MAACKNTKFHTTGRRLLGGGYFPYSQPLPANRRSLGAGRGAVFPLTRTSESLHLMLAAFDEKILETEQRRDLFSRLAPGWNSADMRVQELRRARSAKKRELEKVLEEIAEEQQRAPSHETSQLWDASKHTDFQRRNYKEDVVDVRKVNYFVQDNQGQLHTNPYLPDIEPRSPRRATFLAPNHALSNQAAPQFALWGPNPTFHRAVRKSHGHWFGAGAQQLDSHRGYLERQDFERGEPRAASFLLRRRPDVGGAILWSALEESKHMTSAQEQQSENIEAMLTARRGYLPISGQGRTASRRLDPELLPTGHPRAVDVLTSPRLERARATESLGSPYAVDPANMLESPQRVAKIQSESSQRSRDGRAASRAEDAEVHPSPSDAPAYDGSFQKKRYFHEESRGKVFACSRRKPADHDAVKAAQERDDDLLCLNAVGASNCLLVEDSQEVERMKEQSALRQKHADELQRRVPELSAWSSVNLMSPAFVSRNLFPRPDLELKVTRAKGGV